MSRIFICVLSIDGTASQVGRIHEAILSANRPQWHIMPSVRTIFLEQKSSLRIFTETDTLTLWHSPNNLNCAGGRQRLLDLLMTHYQLAPDDGVLFLDDDIQFTGDDWLKHFLDRAAQFDVVGQEGRIIGEDGNSYPHNGKPIEYLSGGWCMWNGYVLLDPKVNMDTEYSIFFEDVDICFQARRAGYTLGEVNSPHLFHESIVNNEKLERHAEGRRRFMSKWFK